MQHARKKPVGRRTRLSQARRLLAALSALVACVACEPGVPDTPHPLADYNIIVINIDTLRADRVGAYGNARNTSPFMDRLAAEGVLFENAYANSSYTRQSVAALLTGRLPSCAGSLGWAAHPARDVASMGQHFRLAGYRTGFFSNTVMLKNKTFTRGFDSIQHLHGKSSLSGVGPRLSQKALAFVRDAPEARFMLYLHYLDPHAPYEPPPPVRALFPGKPHPQPVNLMREVRPGITQLVANGFGPGEARFEDMVLRYEAEIRHTDLSIALLVAGLREMELIDRTAIVITADHGEELLEHGYVDHAWTLHREVLHVPLLFWAPRALAPARVATPVSGVDVLPTLLDLTGLSPNASGFDGAALFERGREIATQRPIVSELMIRERTMQRSVSTDDWKYVATYQWLEPGERGRAAGTEHAKRKRGYATPMDAWPAVIREELYQLSSDPDERTDVSEQYPERVKEARAVLENVRDTCTRQRPAPEPEPESPLDPEEEERLRALGYL